jgi:hypothetical protein
VVTVDDDTAPIYATSRVGSAFQYTFGQAEGLEPGQSYTVALHFAEMDFSEAGDRTFTVQINGDSVLQDLDVFAAAGDCPLIINLACCA